MATCVTETHSLSESSLPIVPKNHDIIPSLPVRTIHGLSHPWGVAVSNGGHYIAVVEMGNHCVTFLDREGRKVRSFGCSSSTEGSVRFIDPSGIAVTSDNCLIIADEYRIQKITMEGECIASFGGTEDSQIISPTGLAISPTNGQLYVPDCYKDCIHVLDPKDLTYSHSFAKRKIISNQVEENKEEKEEEAEEEMEEVEEEMEEEEVEAVIFSKDGVCSPYYIDFDKDGLLYVTSWSGHCIKIYTPEGDYVSQIGTEGSGQGQLHFPSGITINKTNNRIYVAETGTLHRVSVFTLEGEFIGCFGQVGANEGQFESPIGMTFDKQGTLYVCDHSNNRLLVY